MSMKRWLLILTAVFVLATGSANAQTGKAGPMAKLPHSLLALHAQHAAHVARRTVAPFSSGDPLVRLVDDRVIIDAIASGDVDTLKADLESLGMQNAVVFGRSVSGQLPISSIAAAATLATLRFAQPAVALTNAGTVTSQGEHAMRSDVARTTFGVDGTGVKVGVLSDSFNCLGSAATDVANGDLSPVTVIQEISNCSDATDEGRAMLQIVHDVAPGATLSFASAFNGMASFATNIQALAAAGAKVIVDDVVYFAEPFFQDGIIAQAVDQVVATGAAYFAAAGNQGRQSYESSFRPGSFFADGAKGSAPGAPHFFGGIAHNFKSGRGKDHFQKITIPGNTTVSFVLQWDSPFFSVSGSPGTQNDLDIYVLNSNSTQVLAASAFDNIGNDAVEVATFTNNRNKSVNVNVMIVKFSGADPGLIKYIYFFSGSPPTIKEYNTNSSTIFGHANAAGAEAVGAAAYFDTPPLGVSPPVLEPYSSSGATAILFDLAGNPTSDPRAVKPEIVAPDCSNTTFFVSGLDLEPDGFPNFCGTSAAASHAAAVAALLVDLKATLAPTQIYEALEHSASDMGFPGFDNDNGFGLIQADVALAAVPR
jgi:Subtilase family